MSDLAFDDFSEQALSLSYEQTILLMEILLESLKSKRIVEDYTGLEKNMARTSINAMWEELKNDTW